MTTKRKGVRFGRPDNLHLMGLICSSMNAVESIYPQGMMTIAKANVSCQFNAAMNPSHAKHISASVYCSHHRLIPHLPVMNQVTICNVARNGMAQQLMPDKIYSNKGTLCVPRIR